MFVFVPGCGRNPFVAVFAPQCAVADLIRVRPVMQTVAIELIDRWRTPGYPQIRPKIPARRRPPYPAQGGRNVVKLPGSTIEPQLPVVSEGIQVFIIVEIGRASCRERVRQYV